VTWLTRSRACTSSCGWHRICLSPGQLSVTTIWWRKLPKHGMLMNSKRSRMLQEKMQKNTEVTIVFQLNWQTQRSSKLRMQLRQTASAKPRQRRKASTSASSAGGLCFAPQLLLPGVIWLFNWLFLPPSVGGGIWRNNVSCG